jgi:hypothetical protein
MRTKVLRGVAIFLLIEVGLVHYLSSQHEFEESWILGYLFVANFIGALVAAYGIYRRKTWGWALGLLIAVASLAAYVWSRTSGLPGLRPEEWIYPWGVVSVVAEFLFCLVALLYARFSRGQAGSEPANVSFIWRNLAPIAGLIILVLVNFSTYQVDARYPELDHAHVFFLWQVRLQPELSVSELKDQHGLQPARAGVSAMDSIVDIRLKVVDREKADEALEDGHFAILVGDKLIQSPHVARHMLKNRTIIIFFPNQGNVVKSGTPVSIVFENFRVEPVLAS